MMLSTTAELAIAALETETPDQETVESNLEMFLNKWESLLSAASLDSITNLRKHIRKGCCSGIPAGVGTQKNERLHKTPKQSLLGGASTLSPELAVAVFSIVLYVWSCKRNPGARKHVSNARVIPVVPIEVHSKNKTHVTINNELVFNCATSCRELPPTLTRGSNISPARYLSNVTLPDKKTKDLVEISDLKNNSVLALVISRAIHLKEVFSSIDNMRITRDFNIYEFPLANKRCMITLFELTMQEKKATVE